MSRKKYQKNDNSLGGRLHKFRSSRSEDVGVFSKLLGVSQGSLSAYENNKTTISSEAIINLIQKTDINIEWLLIGKGEMLRKGSVDTYIYKEGDDPELIELLKKSREILKSDTEYALSLAINIRSFHKCILIERRLHDHEERLRRIEEDKKAAAERVRKEDPSEAREELIKLRAN